jgi:integrase
MATLTLATGLRASNVTGLTWEQVDLERRMAWVHPDQAKARKAIVVPLNGRRCESCVRRSGGIPCLYLSTKASR